MAKINYSKLALVNSDDAIDAAILSVQKRGDSVQMDIHRILYALTERWHTTGDVRPAVRHVNMLIDNMPKGIRCNAIRSWVEVHMGMIFAEEGENKGKFVAGKRKAKELDLKGAMNERWFEFKAEAPYKPMNFEQMFATLMTKAAKADPAKGDEVDKGLVEALAKAKHEYMQSKIDF